MENNASILRAVRGPVVLITIGILFALNNFTRFRFEQTWPVILIVFGLLSILRRGVEPPRQQMPPQMPPVPPNPPVPPRPYTPPPPTYSQSPYSQPASGPVKGGFGSSAPPKPPESPAPQAPPTEGGTQ